MKIDAARQQRALCQEVQAAGIQETDTGFRIKIPLDHISRYYIGDYLGYVDGVYLDVQHQNGMGRKM